MARVVLLVLLLGMIKDSKTYWLPWRSTPVHANGSDVESLPDDCLDQISAAECRVRFTKEPMNVTLGLQLRVGYECTPENGVHCIKGPDGADCPDLEIRFWCNDTSNQPVHHWTLASGARVGDLGLTSDEKSCKEQALNPLDYHVVGVNGMFSLVPAPDVLEYACTISTGGGAYIDLGQHPGSCVSDPSICSGGLSTWSIWVKLNYTENDEGRAYFVSSGTGYPSGAYFARMPFGEFYFGAATSSMTWFRALVEGTVPDGSWFHLAIWINTTTQILVGAYINGNPVEDGLVVAMSREPPVKLSNGSLTLGTDSDDKGQDVGTAAYSDLMIFERILSEEEIRIIYDCGVLSQVVSVWDIQQMEASNPNELRYQCIRRTKSALGYDGFVWSLYSVAVGGALQSRERKRESPSRDSTCFFKSELVINKYTDLVRKGYEGQVFVVCEVGPDYKSLEITEDLTYEWTSWLSSSRSHENAVGDNETLAHILEAYPDGICSYPVDIECRERYTMKSYEFLRDKESVVASGCDISEGLLCLHANQSSGPCPDFEVRFMCAGETGSVEIDSMLITSLSDDVLEVACRIEDGAYNLSWSLYDVTTDLDTAITGEPVVNITSYYNSSHSENKLLLSALTVTNPFSKNFTGRYVVCHVLSFRRHMHKELAYDSLRVDNVFHGKVHITPSTMSPLAYGINLTLECTVEDDTVHSMEWYRASLDNTPFYTWLNSTERYIRSAHYGGKSQLQIDDFQSANSGCYLCVVNWWSAKANVTLVRGVGIGGALTKQPSPGKGGTSSDQVDPTAAVPLTSIQTVGPGIRTVETTAVDTFTSGIPTRCELVNVNLQTAITCGNARYFDSEPEKLQEAEKGEMMDFLNSIVSWPVDELTATETTQVAEAVLMVFSKLTEPEQSLSIQEETDIFACTEEAFKVLAGAQKQQTCTTLKYKSNAASLCHGNSVDVLSEHTFTFEVPVGPDAVGNVTDTLPESVEFNPSNLGADAKDVTVIALRASNGAHKVKSVKQLEQTSYHPAVNETWIQLNSAHLTFSLFVQGDRTPVPVTFSLNHLEEIADDAVKDDCIPHSAAAARNRLCAFIDAKDNQIPQWSLNGCELIRDKSSRKVSSCACSHSTTFAVLMQVKSYEVSHADSLALTWITYFGCATSMVMLALTLAVFVYLRRMLPFDRSFIHTNLSIAILVAQILFVAGIDRTENRVACKVVALLLHFCYLSVFAWMLVEGVHLYMKVVKVYGSENVKMYPYLLIGWGIPAIITLVSFGAGADGYGTCTSCWLDTSSGMIWAFVAPALLVIVINMIVLASVVRIVIRSAQVHRERKFDHIKAGIKGAAMLLPILGLTWVFGLLAVNSATIVFQYLFTIFNSFQGLLIFLINCAINSEVRAAFARNKEKQKAASEIRTSEHSLALVHLKRTNSSETENTRNGGCCSDDVGAKEHTDITSVRSGSPSSEPENGTSPSNVTQRTHLKRPHSGKVVPMSVDEIPELEKV